MPRNNKEASKEDLVYAPTTMWRYLPLLPVQSASSIVSLGEGMTPLLRARRIGGRVWIKDESRNPTGSMEARAASCAVSMCVERGLESIETACVDEALAIAAYAAAAGIRARVLLTSDAPRRLYAACRAYGARIVSEVVASSAAVADASGLKTIGYEIAEQMNGHLPDAVICPTGPAAAALREAFAELHALGRVDSGAPHVVEAPPIPMREAVDIGIEIACAEGILISTRAAACFAAARLRGSEETIVIVNSGSAVDCLDGYAARFARPDGAQTRKLGGLITPR